jgi:AcrR family transcriptional regulator
MAATQRVMARVGPGELTLAEIAAEAGVTAGALVQRFGSKRGLLLAFMEVWSSSSADPFAQFRRAGVSPLDMLYEYAECLAQMARSPAELAHHMSYLQLDLTDPDFHRHVKKQAIATRTALRELLADAVRQGELKAGLDTESLARQVELTLNGSLWTWAFYQDGSSADWMRADLDALFAPLRRAPARRVKARAARRRAGRSR